MSFSIGIIGLPNVGKSTLFKILTKKKVEIASYPFTTLHPNYGIATIPDERLKQITELIKPEKITPATIEFIDIAGLIKGAHKGEGLGNQFLAQIRNCDAILEVIRCFEDERVENLLGEINPEKEIEIIKTELLMKDLEILERVLIKIEKEIKKDKKLIKKFDLLKRIKEEVSQGKLISEINFSNNEEKSIIKEYQFLTQKPIFYLLNIDNKNDLIKTFPMEILKINLKEEEEISELLELEKEKLDILSPYRQQFDNLILACYNILDLIIFYTITGGKEIRAWILKKGSKASKAGGIVHSDFEKKFIRAEVIPWNLLIEYSSWIKAREFGKIKIIGKDYIVNDGDVIEFKI